MDGPGRRVGKYVRLMISYLPCAFRRRGGAGFVESTLGAAPVLTIKRFFRQAGPVLPLRSSWENAGHPTKSEERQGTLDSPSGVSPENHRVTPPPCSTSPGERFTMKTVSLPSPRHGAIDIYIYT